jgi:hypothetical protein
VQSGKLGAIKYIVGTCFKPRWDIGKSDRPLVIPKQVDYELWCGPAAKVDLYRPERNSENGYNPHYDWHWDYNTGCGDMGNQGIHQMDIARWGLGVDTLSTGVVSYGGRFGYTDAGETANTQVIMHDYGDKSLVFEVRGLETKELKGANVGVIFEGTDGYVVLTSYTSGAAFDPEGKLITKFEGGGDHHDNLVKAVRSRKFEDLNADILQGHLSSALCHLGNISYRLGSKINMKDAEARLATNDGAAETFERFSDHLKDNGLPADKVELGFGKELRFDPKEEKFINDSQADQMLTREYRAPFVVPAAGKV